MDGILWILGCCAAALFGTALAVSAWEHLRPGARRKAPPPEPPPAPTAVTAVDVEIDAPASDAERRRGILDDTLSRLTQPDSLHAEVPTGWIETAPMVVPRSEPPPPH